MICIKGIAIPTPLNWKDIDIQEVSNKRDNFSTNFRPETSSKPHFILENEHNDFLWDLGLLKQKAKRLSSRLQE